MAKAAVTKGRLPTSTLLHDHDVPPQAAVNASTLTTYTMPVRDTIPTPDYMATRRSSTHGQSKLATGTS